MADWISSSIDFFFLMIKSQGNATIMVQMAIPASCYAIKTPQMAH